MSSGDLWVRVVQQRDETPDIRSFDLERTNGEALPAFSAGSHIDVHLPGGLTRQYSLCSRPTETHRYQIAVLREATSRGGSRTLHDEVRAGDLLGISTPKNHFALAPAAAHSILLAGGIGVTPLLCMAEQLSAAAASFEMHYCTRSHERTAFVQRLRSAPFAAQVAFHHDDGPDDQRLPLDALIAHPRPGVHVYVCGPKGFMDWVLGEARVRGWPAEQLHFEFFANEIAHGDADGSFEVQLGRSGLVLTVPKDKTVVQILADAGVDVPTSCEQGVCGTCLTRVLEGEPDHRDLYLTPEEQAANDQFTPCCSRARSRRLILDL